MKKIRLDDEDFGMFDDEISPAMYEYFLRHKDAFKQMWQDQGRKFWARFVYCFKSFTQKHNLMKDFPAKPDHYEELFEEHFKYIHNEFVKGKYSHAKNLVMDVVVVAQSRHMVQNLESKSFAKDPFYHKETRDVYRRLFGPPGEKDSLLKVYFFLSTYLKFGGSVVECLRLWVGADLCASDDETYWRGPNMETVESAFTTTTQGTKNKEKESFNPVNIYSDDFDLSKDGEIMYKNELANGSRNGPRFIKGWVYGDPRLVSAPENPLHDKDCDGSGDWRKELNKIMYLRFLVFCKNWLKKEGEKKIENYLSESFFKMMTEPSLGKKKANRKPTTENGRKKKSPPPSAKPAGPKNTKGSTKPKSETANGSIPNTKAKAGSDDSQKSDSKKSGQSVNKEEPSSEKMKPPQCTCPIAKQPSITEFCQNAKADKHALDQSLRALLPDDLIPDRYKIVHAEPVEDVDLIDGQKRIRLIAVNQKGKGGMNSDQLTYTITFPKTTPGVPDAEPEVCVEGGPLYFDQDSEVERSDQDLKKSRAKAESNKGKKKDLKPTSNGEVKPNCDHNKTDARPKESCKLESCSLKKEGSGAKPKVEYPERMFIDGCSMSGMMGATCTSPLNGMMGATCPSPLNGDLEGATGGFSLLEFIPVNGNRICTTCLRPEPKPKTYKKCQKCKDMNVRDPRYYCGRECQLIDWRDRHKQEHKDGRLELKTA